MTKPNSNRRTRRKPTALWLHRASRQWCKVVNGQRQYFGTDRDAALERYLARKNGHSQPASSTLKVGDATNLFFAAKRDKRDAGDISARHYEDLLESGRLVVRILGRERLVDSLTPADFADLRQRLSRGVKRKVLSPSSVAKRIGYVKSIFGFAYSNGYSDTNSCGKPAFSRVVARL